MGVLCTWVKFLTDLQILDWVAQNTIAPPDLLAVIRGRDGRDSKERVGNMEEEERGGKGRTLRVGRDVEEDGGE